MINRKYSYLFTQSQSSGEEGGRREEGGKRNEERVEWLLGQPVHQKNVDRLSFRPPLNESNTRLPLCPPSLSLFPLALLLPPSLCTLCVSVSALAMTLAGDSRLMNKQTGDYAASVRATQFPIPTRIVG